MKGRQPLAVQRELLPTAEAEYVRQQTQIQILRPQQQEVLPLRNRELRLHVKAVQLQRKTQEVQVQQVQVKEIQARVQM